jgi:hypothetical protein
MEDIVPIHLILMGNTKQSISGIEDTFDSVFDLKGSLQGRLNKEKNPKNTAILKDINIKLKRG